MAKFADRTYRADQLLPTLLRERGWEHKLEEARVFAAWKDAVGESIDRNTQPVSLVNGKLTVWTAHNVWMSELLLERNHVIEKINEKVGRSVVQELALSVKPVQPNSRPRSQQLRRPTRLKVRAVEPDSETLARIDQIVGRIEDEDLRESLRRVFIKQSEREPATNEDRESSEK